MLSAHFADVRICNGRLYAPQFDDFYAGHQDHIAEKHHVFIDPIAWDDAPNNHVTIVEAGFGTGVNFLLMLEEWKKHQHSVSTLDYIAFEKYPLPPKMLAEQLHHSNLRYKDDLLATYPPIAQGWHECMIAGCRLLLIYGDMVDNLAQLSWGRQKVDYWFLDGFSPRKNPDLWTDELLNYIDDCSSYQSHVLSFSVQGRLKRGLQERGFVIHPRCGIGDKRDVLHAIRHQETTLNHDDQHIISPLVSANLYPLITDSTARADQHVVIVGGGIAGWFLAWTLRSSGYSCHVVMGMNADTSASTHPAAALIAPPPKSMLYHHGAWGWMASLAMERFCATHALGEKVAVEFGDAMDMFDPSRWVDPTCLLSSSSLAGRVIDGSVLSFLQETVDVPRIRADVVSVSKDHNRYRVVLSNHDILYADKLVWATGAGGMAGMLSHGEFYGC